MNQRNRGQFYSKNKEYFLKQYWEGNDGTDLIRPNGFKEYPVFVYAALCKQINKDGRVLDLGCGNGLLLRHLMQYSGHKLIPYGIEFLESSIKQAKKILHPEQADNFEVGNMIDYSFRKGPFDFILFTPSHVYLEDRKNFLDKLRKNCARHGRIIFYAHFDVLKAHQYTWVGEFPELRNWKLIRKDYPQLSIGIWEKN